MWYRLDADNVDKDIDVDTRTIEATDIVIDTHKIWI